MQSAYQLMYSIQACQLNLFNNGPEQLDFYFCSVHSKETVGRIGQISTQSFDAIMLPNGDAPRLHIGQLIARIICNDFILTEVKLHYISSMHIHSILAHSKTHTFLYTLLLVKYIHQAKSPGVFFLKFNINVQRENHVLFSEQNYFLYIGPIYMLNHIYIYIYLLI